MGERIRVKEIRVGERIRVKEIGWVKELG